MERMRFMFTLNGKKRVLVEAYDRDSAAEYIVKEKHYGYRQIEMNTVFTVEKARQSRMCQGLPIWIAINR